MSMVLMSREQMDVTVVVPHMPESKDTGIDVSSAAAEAAKRLGVRLEIPRDGIFRFTGPKAEQASELLKNVYRPVHVMFEQPSQVRLLQHLHSSGELQAWASKFGVELQFSTTGSKVDMNLAGPQAAQGMLMAKVNEQTTSAEWAAEFSAPPPPAPTLRQLLVHEPLERRLDETLYGEFALKRSLADFTAGSPSRRQFEQDFQADLARTLGVSPNRIVIQDVRPGSTHVVVAILPADGNQPTPKALFDHLKDLVKNPDKNQGSMLADVDSCHGMEVSDSLYYTNLFSKAKHWAFANWPVNQPPILRVDMNPFLKQGCPSVVRFENGRVIISDAVPEFGWHGTGAINPICHDGFDPSKRCGQLYGAGEYFSQSQSADYSICYAQGQTHFILAAILPGPHLSSQCGGTMWVSNNPCWSGPVSAQVSYCLPLAVVSWGLPSWGFGPCICEKVLWQYFVDDGVDGKATGWYDYTESGTVLLEKDYQQYQQTKSSAVQVRQVKSGVYVYSVDFGALTQTNTSTGTVRKIQRQFC